MAPATVRRSSFADARVHRQGEDVGADAVGFRARAWRLFLQRRLLRNGHRVVNQRLDAVRPQRRLQLVTARGQHREQVVHVPGIALGRDLEAGAGEQLPVGGGVRPPRRGPSREQRQARGQDGRLHVVEAAVHAHLAVMVPVRLAPVADAPHLRGQRVVVGRDGAAVAEGAEVLRGVETVGRSHAERPHGPAVARRQVGLAAVFDDREAARRRDRHDGAHVGRLAVQVHRQHRGGARRDGGFDRGRVDRQPARIDVREHRPCAHHHARQRRVRRRHRRRDHLVAGTDPQPAQDDGNRVGSGADANGVGRAARAGEGLLERVHLRPEHVPPALDHAPDGGVDGLAVLSGDKAHERDAGCGHGAAGSLSRGSR